MTTPANLAANIEAYEAMQQELEERHPGEHVAFQDKKFADAFNSFREATCDKSSTVRETAPVQASRVGPSPQQGMTQPKTGPAEEAESCMYVPSRTAEKMTEMSRQQRSRRSRHRRR